MATKNLADRYGTPLVEWEQITAELDRGLDQAPGTGGPDRHTVWLATIDRDGRPHVTGIGALWVDDALWFGTGEGTRKGKNLARDPRCTLSLATHDFDLVVEGDKIVNRYIERGTLTGVAFLGIDPAGQRYEKPGTTVYRVENERLTESWGVEDTLGWFRQLGKFVD